MTQKCMFVEGSQEQSFFLQTLLFTPFVATVQKIMTYALVSTAQDGSTSHDFCTTVRSIHNHMKHIYPE